MRHALLLIKKNLYMLLLQHAMHYY